MDIALLRLYENDYDYKYEQTFIVKNDKEKIEKLLTILEEIDNLDYEERERKYLSSSKIEIAETYIRENLTLINCSRYDIDLY